MVRDNLHLYGVSQVRLISSIPLRGIFIANLRPLGRIVYFAIRSKFFEDPSYHGRDCIKYILLGNKTHFHIKLIKIGWRAICTRIFISKTGSNLKIFIKPRNHYQLLKLLRGLRKGIKFTRMQSRGY